MSKVLAFIESSKINRSAFYNKCIVEKPNYETLLRFTGLTCWYSYPDIHFAPIFSEPDFSNGWLFVILF